MILRRLMLAAGLAAAACLQACTGAVGLKAGIDPAAVSAQVDAAQSRYDAVKPVAEMVLPFLPASTQARVRVGLAAIEEALAVAHVAATAAEQLAAVHKAAAETERIEALTVTPE